ncbi:hypothetical protein EBZ38_12675 [bacterium]|nr:hypothetical protein [bacterium]
MRSSRPKTKVSNVTDLFSKPHEENVTNNSITYLNEFEEQAIEYLKDAGVYKGISTGYEYVDWLIGSFLPGELWTIGGDTGHGKSLFAMNVAQNVYDKYQEPVLFINLELTVEQAVQRFYNLSGDDHDYAGIMVQTSPDVDYKDVDTLISKAKDEGVRLVVVDHLHFFDGAIGDNAASSITRLMRHFKKCAVKYEMPVIMLSHVTPQTKITKDGLETVKPDLHSFKNSKSIEQLSDMVGFVWREQDDTNRVEFYIRKNRSRPLIKDSIYFTQKGWVLEEDKTWQPKNYPPFGVSSLAKTL